MQSPKIYIERTFARLMALFGQGLLVSIGVILLAGLVLSAAVFMYMEAAAPDTLTIAGGPAGSIFQKTAEKYQAILAKNGVTLKIIPSEGSLDNFNKLSNPRIAVDVGFVLGGQVNGAGTENLVSLGSISYQPMMIFYRGAIKNFLSDFKGHRLYTGPKGSGTDSLARALLKVNGIQPDGDTILVNALASNPEQALLDNRVDAIFLMGETTPLELMRHLMHAPDIHIFTSTRQPWLILPPDVPAMPEYYDRERYWPPESLARRAAVLAGASQ